MALKFLDTKPIPSSGGSAVLNSSRQSIPGFHVRKLIARFKLNFSVAGTTFNAKLWGISSTARILFRDNYVWCSNVNLASLDFLARARKQGLSHSGLEFNDRTGAPSAYQEVWLEIPVLHPTLRNPEDVVFPVDELGDVTFTVSNSAGIAVGTFTGGQVDLYAEGEHLPNIVLGPRPFWREQNADGSGVVNMPYEGALPTEIFATQTNTAVSLGNVGTPANGAIQNGFYLELDGEQVVDGIQAATIEANDGLTGERFYSQIDYPTPAAGYGPYSGWSAGSTFGRIYQIGAGESLADLKSTQKAKFVAIAPNATNILTTRLLYCGFAVQDSGMISQRRISMGLPPMMAASDADSGATGVSADVLQKLPVKLKAR